jgi:penicillin-binding protein 2
LQQKLYTSIKLIHERDFPVRRIAFMLIIFLVACSPEQPGTVREVNLPTLVPMPTVAVDLEEPHRAAMTFLGAWQAQDFLTMYSLISFSSQETISPDDFRELYEDTQNTMTMNSLDFEGRGLNRMGDQQVAQLEYDVTFHTNLLGDITDSGRQMTILFDSQTNQWRVAWSVGTLFTELAAGARLEFQPNPPSRANIYDRNGTVIANMQGRMVEVFVIREKAPNWEICRSTISEIIGITPERVDLIFSEAQPDWKMSVGLMERQAFETTDQSKRLETDCLATFEGFATRQYLPNGSVMPHVLGFVGLPSPEQVDDLVLKGFNSESIIGQAGIEQSWNDTLMGRPGGQLALIASDGTVSRILAQVSSGVSESLWLTIDLNLQQFVNSTINTFYAQARTNGDGSPGWGSTSPGAAAVVMEVNTGEVLAMASFPNYDANAFTAYPVIGREIAQNMQADIAANERRPMLNRATQGGYPSGSIFKVIDAAAVLDTGVYTVDTSISCVGFWTYEGDTRDDWYTAGHGRVNTQSALMQSCNPFFYQAGFLLNSRDPFLLPGYARRMGLGDFTGLTDIPEISGQIPDPDFLLENYGLTWTYSSAVNLAIGQGELAVTPLQMARLYGAIANGGNLMKPYLVRERGILNERTLVAVPTVVSTFGISDYAMNTVRAGLCDVVTGPMGTAAHIFRDSLLIDTVGVCGKTGTAQDTPRANHSWFVAYAPKDEPEIVVLVLVENSGDGSAIAAPITKEIMEYYFYGQEQ